jgi:hypothetical protein
VALVVAVIFTSIVCLKLLFRLRPSKDDAILLKVAGCFGALIGMLLFALAGFLLSRDMLIHVLLLFVAWNLWICGVNIALHKWTT